MYKLILLRHGESTWNLENRFTGWTDIDLTEKGVQEAITAGEKLKEANITPQFTFTSYQKRAIKTLNLVLETMDLMWLPVEKTWRLNEKHYGALQGLNKKETAKKYGDQQVLIWRRSYNTQPPALDPSDPRHPINDPRYHNLPEPEAHPATESLEDAINRSLPFFKNEIMPKLHDYKTVLVAAHGNSLRGIVKYLKSISNEDIVGLNIPTGIPYVFEFDENMQLQKDYYLADPETLEKLMAQVANQGKQ